MEHGESKRNHNGGDLAGNPQARVCAPRWTLYAVHGRARHRGRPQGAEGGQVSDQEEYADLLRERDNFRAQRHVLADHIIEVLDAQKKYFASRAKADLITSKQMEAK